MDRYNKQRTETTSAYCPICCKKTINLSTGQTLKPTRFYGQDYWCIPVSLLCCSEKCAQMYVARVQERNRSLLNDTPYSNSLLSQSYMTTNRFVTDTLGIAIL